MEENNDILYSAFFDEGNIDGFDATLAICQNSIVSSSIANTRGLRYCPSIFPPSKIALYGIHNI